MNTKKGIFEKKFCEERIKEVNRLIDSATTFSVIGFPGIGISIFLRYLQLQPFGNFFYVDCFGLPNLTSQDLFTALLAKLGERLEGKTEGELVECLKNKLEALVRGSEKIVILFGGFDQLKDQFDQELFHYLRTLRSVNPQKIIFIFGICKRIESLISDKLMDIDLSLFSTNFYLRPYSKTDLVYLLSIYGPKIEMEEEKFERILSLSGGHFQLLQLLLKSERVHDPLLDPFIKLSFRNIYQHLTHQQKKIVQKLAVTGSFDKKDDYLLKVGLVFEANGKYQLFTPLFAEFIKTQTPLRLSVKERKLFNLLKQNLGGLVSKDKIFETVWGNQFDEASDWALDSLIYRLRKNSIFISSGYLIENDKKLGYRLVKN